MELRRQLWVLRLALGIALGVALLAVGGCRTSTVYESEYRYFNQPTPEDAWSRKIRGWQRRELADTPTPTPAVGTEPQHIEPGPGGELRGKYERFRLERKRELASELAEWIQLQATDHYRPDGPVDHWATLEETFRNNGDDCDGLELLVYHFLRELGFGEDEVFRAIVYRPSDGQHHMVTMWFEDPEDPWVIDPTGAMTQGMPRMSDVPGWVPLKVFSEDRDFTVRGDGLRTANR